MHKDALQELLLKAIEANGGTLPGSVSKSDVMCLDVYDLLDLANDLYEKHGYGQFGEILYSARTPPDAQQPKG